MEEYAMKLAVTFAEAVTKSTYDWVSAKTSLAREKKTTEDKQNAYEDIINKLLQDKSELGRIAGEYKDLYEKVIISDKDIEYLQETLQKVFQQLSDPRDTSESKKNMELLINVINKDTLKIMQLLGFNYKEAIGKPLTELCASFINKLGENKTGGSKTGRK